MSHMSVTIPANLERPDRLIANLTARQLAILTPAALATWLLYEAAHPVLPLPVIAALAIPLLGAAATLTLVQRDGIGLDRLAVHAIAYRRAPNRLIPAPEPIPALPAWATTAREATGPTRRTTSTTSRTAHTREAADRKGETETAQEPVPLRLPARAIAPNGAINLGADGVAVLIACSTVSFSLRTPSEQAGLVGAFGGWLNSLAGPVQILIHAAPINLAPAITALRDQATALPHPALEDAALDHAHFLAELAMTRDLLARRVLVVIREPHSSTTSATTGGGTGRTGEGGSAGRRDAAAAGLRALRRADQAVRALAGAGIAAIALDGEQASAVLAGAADPTAPPLDGPLAAPGEVITGTTGATCAANGAGVAR